jgi:hypothetical protein
MQDVKPAGISGIKRGIIWKTELVIQPQNNVVWKSISLFFLPAGPLEEKENCMPVRTGRIHRPPNAYILFTKEWRRQVASEYSEDTNQGISTRWVARYTTELQWLSRYSGGLEERSSIPSRGRVCTPGLRVLMDIFWEGGTRPLREADNYGQDKE